MIYVSLPKKSLSMDCIFGMRVEPPTNTTSLMSALMSLLYGRKLKLKAKHNVLASNLDPSFREARSSRGQPAPTYVGIDNGSLHGLHAPVEEVDVDLLEPGAYTRPLFSSTLHTFAGYAGWSH